MNNNKLEKVELNNQYVDYLMLKDYKNEKVLYDLFQKNNYYIINEIKKKYINTKEIDIIGKGTSAKYKTNGIGVNQSIIFTNKEFLFLNDFVSFFGIEEFIKDIKYIFIPDYPHNGSQAIKDLNYIHVFEYLTKYHFKGKIFIYQIQSTLSDYILDEFKFHSFSSIDIPIYFFNKFMNINVFNLYGIGTSHLYHKDLLNINFTNIKNDENMKVLFDKYILNYLINFNSSLSMYDHDRKDNINNKLNDLKEKINIIINLY